MGIRTVLISLMLVMLFVAGCATKRPDEVLWQSPEKCGEWTRKAPENTAQYLYFVGLSNYCATEKQARSEALVNSLEQIAQYSGVDVRELSRYYLTYAGKSSAVYDPRISRSQYTRLLTRAFIRRAQIVDRCTQILARKGKPWKAFVLVRIARSEIERIERWREKKRLVGAEPILSYAVNDKGILLKWGGPIGRGLSVAVYKWAGQGRWEKIGTGPTEEMHSFLLKDFKWGDRFKIRIFDTSQNWIDSNVVTLTRECPGEADVFYIISSEATIDSECFEEFVDDFRTVLGQTLKSLGKSYQCIDAICADKMLDFIVRQEEASGGFRVRIDDRIKGVLLYKSRYVYPLEWECRGMVHVDRVAVKKALVDMFRARWPEMFPTRTGQKESREQKSVPEFFAVSTPNPVSLMEASKICKRKGGRLLNFYEWMKARARFRDKNREGEYVLGGRVYFNTNLGKWVFERIYQPEEVNAYCVRCIKRNN